VTWIGYPNSTGLAAVDYRLTDAAADAPGSGQTFAEELVRLPGCFLCYTPAPDAPPVAPLPALEHGARAAGPPAPRARTAARVWAAGVQQGGPLPAARCPLPAPPQH